MEIGLGHLIDDELTAHTEESRRFNQAAEQRGRPDLSSFDGLMQTRADHAMRPSEGLSRTVERLAEIGGRQVPVRIIAPQNAVARALYLDIAGGGFFLGLAARGDIRNAQLADALGVTVVSVDYRLAPESPWPAAPDDCETAALWVLEHGEALFGTSRLFVGGASAGSNLALTTLLRLRQRGHGERVGGVVLQFGAYDLSGQTPGGRLYADEYFIEAYVGHIADRTNPDISPLFADLSDLPPALVIVGALDILLEDNLAMAARLSGAGGEVDVRVFPESTHGFTSSPTKMADAAWDVIESWVADKLPQQWVAVAQVGVTFGLPPSE
jgi:acetyl esterase